MPSNGNRSVDMMIYRAGEVCEHWRRVEQESNSFNEVSPNEIFEQQDDTIVALHFASARDERLDKNFGEADTVEPSAIFPLSTTVVSEDQIKYRGDWYEVTAPTPRLTHIECDAEIVQPGETVEDIMDD